MTIGWISDVLNKNKEIAFMFDVDMFIDTANRVHMKRLAIDT
ncbi:phage portal protein, partial [Bacillus toyonensis]